MSSVRYCPRCGDLVHQNRGSRFVRCPEHGRLIVTVSEVGKA